MTIVPPVRIATAGEALIDLVADAAGAYQPCLGGAPFNLTRALARQGLGVAYLNPLSADRFGRQLAAALTADGATLGAPTPVAAPTALAIVSLDAHGHPAYAFYREGVADRATSSAALTAACAALPDLAIVCSGCLALAPADGPIYHPWLAAQRAAGRLVVIDVNLRPGVMPDLDAYRAHVLATLAYADIIKASDEDLAVLGLDGADAAASARRLFDHSPARLIALTEGAAGASLLRRAGAVRARETAPLQVVDTVGAGDSFLAGLLAQLLAQADARGLSAAAALDSADAGALLTHAIATASLNVQRQGCQPPQAAEVAAWCARGSIQPY
ncbi:PfkB family carbohydrate kinase [Massilia sp. TS11]|uniref:PfkB family carbohydrate kinase n=1 Tax=Massilia sp. TS11 TaxID=2908003 RepID=UPI001EDA5049|nr:PfkB family carbohydrate kinase [Massilia sp. TS11]MCG2586735.1 PfkB family carbohydrate kinase [Massilia sp. TS11]